MCYSKNLSSQWVFQPTGFPRISGFHRPEQGEIIKGRRRITADTALRLSKYFNTTAKFWLGLQNDYDLEKEQAAIADELAQIVQGY